MARVPNITLTFHLNTPPKKVFQALTTSKGLTSWFLKSAEISPKKGGTFRFGWAETGSPMKGKVLAVSPGKRIELQWNDKFDGKRFTTKAQFVLRKKGKGTMLKLTHSGFKGGKKWIWLYGAINSGWAYYLANLKSVLDHGTDLRDPLDAM